MSDIGRKGGEHRHGGASEQHSRTGSHSHKDTRNDDKSHSRHGDSSEEHSSAGSRNHKHD
jgi:hypothetical protein